MKTYFCKLKQHLFIFLQCGFKYTFFPPENAYCAHYHYSRYSTKYPYSRQLDFGRQLMTANSFTTPYLIWNPWHSVKSDHMVVDFPLACIRIAECHPVQQHIATNQMHTTHTDIRVDYKFTILLNNKGTRVIV